MAGQAHAHAAQQRQRRCFSSLFFFPTGGSHQVSCYLSRIRFRVRDELPAERPRKSPISAQILTPFPRNFVYKYLQLCAPFPLKNSNKSAARLPDFELAAAAILKFEG
jgi:hypothetical protein